MPDGAFALYLAGQFNKRTAKKAAATRGACHGYVQFNRMNHFGINDFYPGTHQARPCRARTSYDMAGAVLKAADFCQRPVILGFAWGSLGLQQCHGDILHVAISI